MIEDVGNNATTANYRTHVTIYFDLDVPASSEEEARATATRVSKQLMRDYFPEAKCVLVVTQSASKI